MAKLGMADEEEKECLVQLLGERRRRNVLSRDGEKKRGNRQIFLWKNMKNTMKKILPVIKILEIADLCRF